MKGPRSRHRFCVLRVWECPRCQKRVAAPVQVVNRVCVCLGKDRPTAMHLVEERRRAAWNAVPLPPIDPALLPSN